MLTFTVFRAVVEQSPPPAVMPARLVYAASNGGGGSPKGGDNMPAPRQMAQVIGVRPTVTPAARPAPQPSVTPPPRMPPEPLPTISIGAPPVDAGVRESVGTLAGLPSGSLGPGNGPVPGEGGQGRGRGGQRGIGEGPGNDVGEPGNGATWPKLLREVKPNYTAEAMRAQIEGLVELEIVVLPDGSVGNVSIRRSLDSRFGLDLEAIKAVRLWRFDPSRQGGKAIASRVGVELSFNLR